MIGSRMLSRLGFWLVTLCFFVSCSEAAQLQLRLLDADGSTPPVVLTDTLYHVEVKLKADKFEQQPERPSIPGLDPDVVRATADRREMSWINGKQSNALVWLFDVIWRQPGEVHLGPVIMRVDGNSVASNSLDVSVDRVSTYAGKAAKHGLSYAGQGQTYAAWEPLKTDCYVGEGIPCRLSFYTTDESVAIEGISQFQPQQQYDLTLKQQTSPEHETKKGVTYYVARWEGMLYPKAPGELVLPQMAIVYRSTRQAASSFMGMFSFFMPTQAYQVVVPSVTLRSKPLPPTNKKIAGVGQIKTIMWKAAQTKAPQGEAFVVTRLMTGNFDPATVALELPAVTDGLKIYKSGTTTEGSYPDVSLSDEFVVQGIKPGRGEIAAQTYWFFNPERLAYESVTTAPVALEIAPAIVPVAKKDTDTTVTTTVTDGILTTSHGQSVTASNYLDREKFSSLIFYRVPFWLFIVLFLLPFLILAIKDLCMRWYARLYFLGNLWRVKRRFLREVKAAAAAGDGKQLHGAFVRFVMAVIPCKEDSLQESVRRWLERQGSSAEVVAEWNELYETLQLQAYAPIVDREQVNVVAPQLAFWASEIINKARSSACS